MSIVLGSTITIADALDRRGTSLSADTLKGKWPIQIEGNTLRLGTTSEEEEDYTIDTPSGVISLYTGDAIGYPILDTLPIDKGSMIMDKSTQYDYVVSPSGYLILNRGTDEYEIVIYYNDQDQAIGIDITPDSMGILDTIATYVPQVSFSDDPDSIIPDVHVRW